MSKEVPIFMQPFYEADQELYELMEKTMGFVHEDGALEKKYKHMISMVADALVNHPNGAVACGREALAAGATKEQLREAMRIVFSAGGLPMLLENAEIYRQLLI